MSIKIFEEELRKECKKAFADLKNGERMKRLQKKSNKDINSMADVFNRGNKVSIAKLYRSCLITFGHVLEKTTMDYAKAMGQIIYPKKNFLGIKIDIVFRIIKKVYNLESKCNIELDAGKSKKALETLQRKHKTVVNALDCHNEGWQVISKFVVWTKATAKDAEKTAKYPIKEKHLMGFKEFFELFNIKVEANEFFDMLQKVFKEEVEAYF